ncbi:hypothetical protein SPRG_04957 [Saprolegnia parasitica CBS 223.65]|uniref:Uncharacterized protein n=1 Tax=Saprolegnia parasitica (strain CBS 223.65) TaxID=695850 RepID=A0A067CKZ9_SAPPC|nr:hypothetical protein SPRG_04957 [Saprolegnia parasitica CBS 223.65]KDO29890.1 hypothetical protein SPRG_04957 [Saprolegnia parasitica CBS 223.65]|eukprot:XP_012199485.1 hypothetical protein SPRG_04957 [Saprolegnia parasitica CBS 223.65]
MADAGGPWRLMSSLRKRKFFEEANKLYPLRPPNGQPKTDLFDFLLATLGRPHNDTSFGCMLDPPDDFVAETRPETEATPRPVVLHNSDMVPETRCSDEPAAVVADDSIVPETRFSDDGGRNHDNEIVPETVDVAPTIRESIGGADALHESISSSSSYAASVTFGGPNDMSLNSSSHSCATLDDSFAAFPSAHLPPPTPPTETLRSPTPLTQAVATLPLVDYFDTDHYTELVPCYVLYAVHCNLHDAHLSHPHLLFCALDQFLASQELMHGYIRRASEIARVVFASRWARRLDAFTKDIDIRDYTERGRSLPGVCAPVWHIIAAHWRHYKAHVLHSDEFYLGDTTTMRADPGAHCRHVTSGYFAVDGHLRDEATRRSVYGGSDVGAYYMTLMPRDASNRRRDTDDLPQRMYLPQESLSFAFKQLEANLRVTDPHVAMYPMGTFARGGLYGSVLDVLVLPTPARPSIHDVVAALEAAHVVEPGAVRSVSAHRLIAPIRFKHIRLLLDLKMYPPPMAYAAMIYFTGPQAFAQHAFCSVLAACGDDTRFETVYETLQTMHGPARLAQVLDEQDMMVLLGHAVYQPPLHRF